MPCELSPSSGGLSVSVTVGGVESSSPQFNTTIRSSIDDGSTSSSDHATADSVSGSTQPGLETDTA